MKFKRNRKQPTIEVTWNPQEGNHQPFENVIEENTYSRLKYRGKRVVVMNGEYYQVIRSWWDFHPDLNNGAVLAPLTLIKD